MRWSPVVLERCRGAPPPGPRRVVRRSQRRVDHISALPDDLLLQVLVRLRCARTAARTSLLARRWRGFWSDLPEVSFRGLEPDAIHAALAQITRTLEAIDIHVVFRGTGRGELDAGNITSLLHAVAAKSPSKLAITIPLCFLYLTSFTVDLPRFDFATSIELDVEVGGVPFALPPATEFPKLEKLSLYGCIMDLAALVRGCPRLRILDVTGTPYTVDTIAVHSASLQELVLSTFLFTSTVDIVAPALTKLTLDMEHRGVGNSLSVVAPMVEEVTWRCSYHQMDVWVGKMWSVASLEVRVAEKGELIDNDDDDEGGHQPRRARAHVLSLHIFNPTSVSPSQKDFAEELKEIPVTTFSVLELKIPARSHALGPVLLNLLQICTGVQRLDMVLLDNGQEEQVMTDSWPCKEWCPCQENNRKWRTKSTVFSIDLTEVEMKGLKGNEEEIHFVKLLFRCAPKLQRMTLVLPDKVTNDWYNIFLDTVREYPYVKSCVCISVD